MKIFRLRFSDVRKRGGWKVIIKTYIKEYEGRQYLYIRIKIGNVCECAICGLLIVLCILYV